MFPLVDGIMTGMDQKDSNAVFSKPRSSSSTAVACLLLVLLVTCCVPFGRRQATDARHHGGFGPKGQLRSGGALVVDNGSGMFLVDFAGLLHIALCSSFVGRPAGRS